MLKNSNSLKNTETPWKLGAFLAGVGLLAAAALAAADLFTSSPIAEARKRSLRSALLQVLPEFDNDIGNDTFDATSEDGAAVKFFIGRRGGKVVGVAAETSDRNGYGGEITSLCGMLPNGKINLMLITRHNETPGLGARVCQRKEQKTIFNVFRPSPEKLPGNIYLDQFNGKNAALKPKKRGGDVEPESPWRVKKDGGDMLYMTGATVTSRAVSRLAERSVKTFDANRNRLLEEKK